MLTEPIVLEMNPASKEVECNFRYTVAAHSSRHMDKCSNTACAGG